MKNTLDYIMLKSSSSFVKPFPELEGQGALFQSLLDISDEAIFILNKSDFTIIDCNLAAIKLFEAESKSQLTNIQSFRLYNFEPFEFSVNKLNDDLDKQGQYSQEMSFRTCKQNVFWGKMVQKNIDFPNVDFTLLKITKSANYLKDEEWLSEILKSTSRTIGRQYFKQVTKLLCETFDANCAFIARTVAGDENRLKIFYCHGEPLQNNFIEVKNSFVENIMRGYTSFYPNGLGELFPHDKILKKISAKSFIGSPLFDASGQPFGLIGVLSAKGMEEIPNSRYMLHIISSRTAGEIQRIRSKELLRQQTKELAEINHMKDRLLSVISNDLQAPLKTILGYSEMLSNRINSYKPKELSGKIKAMDSSLRHLYMLMENLSDWAKLQQGVLRPSLKRNNIANILDEIKPYIHFIGRLKDIGVINKVPSDFNVWADSYLSRHAIKNLTSYVLKNTMKEGTVVIETRSEGDAMELCLKTTQHSIDKREIELVLNSSPYEISLSADELSISAVGLYISKEFMGLQQGKLIATCQEKEVEFVLTFNRE